VLAVAPDASPEGPRRSTRKRQAIVDAATDAFLRGGYAGTSMDEIAAQASVSKQTVYKHFADKDRLFCDVVRQMVSEVSDPVHDEVFKLRDSGDLEADLRDVARRQLELVLQPRLMQLRRLVIAEAPRFPELGRVFYDQGPARTIAALAEVFEGLAARDLLRFEDAHVAATQFNWLIMGPPINEAMLLGHDDRPPRSEIDRWSRSGVAAFLAGYRAPGRRGRPPRAPSTTERR
jgi:TetR/AcrR family transcriptional regulator, mexJK operon transcriptional repressor